MSHEDDKRASWKRLDRQIVEYFMLGNLVYNNTTNKSLDIWDEGVQSTATAAKTAIDAKVISMFT